jgi:hypothetical protein
VLCEVRRRGVDLECDACQVFVLGRVKDIVDGSPQRQRIREPARAHVGKRLGEHTCRRAVGLGDVVVDSPAVIEQSERGLELDARETLPIEPLLECRPWSPRVGLTGEQ